MYLVLGEVDADVHHQVLGDQLPLPRVVVRLVQHLQERLVAGEPTVRVQERAEGRGKGGGVRKGDTQRLKGKSAKLSANGTTVVRRFVHFFGDVLLPRAGRVGANPDDPACTPGAESSPPRCPSVTTASTTSNNKKAERTDSPKALCPSPCSARGPSCLPVPNTKKFSKVLQRVGGPGEYNPEVINDS
ncbi:hypothetical protein EYF80_049785 [Liparis tanakae]|uniref:Uncharacterized protein n=1 Tax=Liparis tanakae TaxID=230148 RepID=A0A4Z2FGL0_9TELE|nr:hypothetical protein EYF80_049785 [Liparis tanakae]